jgi:dipeptidyl aminopeptidase/acylaminoacyl peptidase
MPGTVASCVMLVHGDMDTVVPVTVGRAWAEAMKSVPMKTYQYIEVPGGDHGTRGPLCRATRSNASRPGHLKSDYSR